MSDPATTLLNRLKGREAKVAESKLLKDLIDLLEPIKFNRIRCLALGSPSTEFQALYQLALLKLLTDKLSIDSVTCYDPVFTDSDTQLLEGLRFSVDSMELDDPAIVSSTLYYMPHVPRSFTETFIKDIQPTYILGNDLTVTAGSLSKVKFLEQLPTLATLLHLAAGEDQKPKDDGFSVVSSRRRKKSSKLVYKEPVLEYPVDEVYFRGVEITRITSDSDLPWKDSFSDMAFNIILRKNLQDTKEACTTIELTA